MKKPKYGHQRKKRQGKLLPGLGLAALTVWGFAVFFWFAHGVGDIYAFHAGLGKPMKLGEWVTYSPAAAWSWPGAVWDNKDVNKLLENSLTFFAAAPLLLFVLGMAVSRNQGAIDDLHGSAHWAEKKEIERMGYLDDNEGVYIGGWWDEKALRLRYLRENGPIHLLCFAPTRSGKGVGLILPTLVSWPGSSVVLDIKGENHAHTSGFLSGQGHRVLRFDPADASFQSTRYNPLEEVRIHSGRCISDIQRVASMVLDPDGKGLEDHWNKAAFSFFGAVILHCMIEKLYKEKKHATLYDVIMTMRDPKDLDGNQKTLFKNIAETKHAEMLVEMFNMDRDLADSMHNYCASAASGMMKTPDKELGSIISTAIVNLALYTDPIIAHNIGASDFHIDDLMNGDDPVNLYLVLSPADIDRVRPLIRIFMAQLLGRLTEKMEFADGGTRVRYSHRLLLMLDEFTSLGKLAIVERAIAYMAGYGLKGYFIVQDTKQLAQTYGQDNALMANCHIRIAYAPNLVETAEYLSKLTGTTTVVQRKKSLSSGKGGAGSSVSVQETARALLTPDECMRLPGIQKAESGYWKQFGPVEPGDMLIFTAGNAPIYGKQILHFIDPTFRERTSMRPVVDGKPFVQEGDEKTDPDRRAGSIDETEQAEDAANAYLRYLDDLPEELAAA